MSTVTVRLWASAKAAAGCAEVEVPVDGPTAVATVLQALLDRFPDRPDLARVVTACSFLIGDQRADREDLVPPGGSVEVLPPFAGG